MGQMMYVLVLSSNSATWGGLNLKPEAPTVWCTKLGTQFFMY